MRYLNKIVFINSANIKYAEINLDGNVHFIGTQGVGKSTILRAILFFYNANKQRLGIRTQQGQKPFDDFYLPNPNSFIIYEVTRENGKFFIMAFRSQGRAAFRFVDCPYQREFLIDGEGNAGYEWGKISQNIGVRVFKSNIVRTQQQYLDILYGNNQAVSRELRRFSIMESVKYQNVPRTIQNIFLNQSLESQVIKDIIIDSMDFADHSYIDLNQIRTEVKDFRMQYEDISKWYRKEKNGTVKVRHEADRVLGTYGTYEACRKMIAELTGQTLFALGRDREVLPKINDKISETKLLLDNKRRAAVEEASKYNKQLAELNKQDGALKHILEETHRKQQHYAEIGINEIIDKISHENELHIRRNTLNGQIDQLTSKNKDVKEKYDQLRQKVTESRKQRETECQRRISDLKVSEAKETGNLQNKFVDDSERIDKEFQSRQQSVQEKRNLLQKEIADIKVNREKIKTANPFAGQMEEDNKRIDSLHADNLQLQKDSAQKQRTIDQITHETELQRKELENKAEADIREMEHEMESINKRIASLSQLLERQKGSFIEWLGNNVRGWENTIGKIADEESVLYNTALNPSKEGRSDSLFGIHIDTDSIDRTVRTPSDIQKEKAAVEGTLAECQNRIVMRRKQLEGDIEQLEKKPSNQLRQLRAEKRDMDAEIQSIPPRIKAAEDDLAKLQEQLQKHRQEQLDANLHQLDNANEQLQKVESEQRLMEADHAKEQDKLRKNFSHGKKEIQAKYAALEDEIDKEITAIGVESEKRMKELDALMDRELHGLGIDTSQLSRLRSMLQDVDSQLSFIHQHRNDYTYWLRDKAELFDHEQENKDKRRALKVKLDDLDDKFAVRKRKLDEGIKMISDECGRLCEQKKSTETAVHETEGFMASESWPAEFADNNVIETVKPLGEILSELKNKIMTLGRNRESFTNAVKQFKGNFTAQNTFHFPTEFNTEADYTNFAANLSEFVGNDMIESYRQRVSDQYARILRTIGYETGNLMSNRSQVQATVNEINRDFRENNFVGVVKDIELRLSDSSDRLVQHLFVIKKFNDEHSDSIGEMDLFTDESQRVQNNRRAVELLTLLMDELDADQKRDMITLADVFKLEFRVRENDNDTGWVERLSNVGSDGTDVLVKAMVNIMLINVFKKKVSKHFVDFRLHCMMDEIGKLHPDNVAGILDFANKRNIYLVNSSPTTYNATAYKYTYSLSKDSDNITVVKKLMTII